MAEPRDTTVPQPIVDEQTKAAGIKASTAAAGLTDAEILAALKAQNPGFNLGVGEALLNDPTYGAELKNILTVYRTNKAKALDLLFASKWAKLRPSARSNYLDKIQNGTLYQDELRTFRERIRKNLKQDGLQDISDAVLEQYFLNGTPDDLILSDAVKGFKFAAGTTGGNAAERYNTLLSTATKNGVSVDKLPVVLGLDNIDEVLKELQLGESLSNFEQKIRNYAKTAMPEWVRGRIDQGENLQDIVSPYISTVADTLEIPWKSVDVTNPYIQSALSQNRTLYDLARDLRKDPTWQYTNKARQETSSAVLNVLRDFGFQG
jgi:hypothetical protein